MDNINNFLNKIKRGEDTNSDDLVRIEPRFQFDDYGLPLQPNIPPMPPVKPPKKKKIERIYEDDDFVIDLFAEEKMVRVSIFDGGHFKDEVFVKKDDYIN